MWQKLSSAVRRRRGNSNASSDGSSAMLDAAVSPSTRGKARANSTADRRPTETSRHPRSASSSFSRPGSAPELLERERAAAGFGSGGSSGGSSPRHLLASGTSHGGSSLIVPPTGPASAPSPGSPLAARHVDDAATASAALAHAVNLHASSSSVSDYASPASVHGRSSSLGAQPTTPTSPPQRPRLASASSGGSGRRRRARPVHMSRSAKQAGCVVQ